MNVRAWLCRYIVPTTLQRAIEKRRLQRICQAHGTSKSVAMRIVSAYFAAEGTRDAQ